MLFSSYFIDSLDIVDVEFEYPVLPGNGFPLSSTVGNSFPLGSNLLL